MNTYFVAGHAKLPAGMAAQTIYETLTVTAELDKKHGVVIEVSCTLATEHGREFISRILRGYCLEDGIEEPVKLIKEHYLGKAGSALATAVKDLYKQYEQQKINNQECS